jgi:hypothetical protein
MARLIYGAITSLDGSSAPSTPGRRAGLVDERKYARSSE